MVFFSFLKIAIYIKGANPSGMKYMYLCTEMCATKLFKAVSSSDYSMNVVPCLISYN